MAIRQSNCFTVQSYLRCCYCWCCCSRNSYYRHSLFISPSFHNPAAVKAGQHQSASLRRKNNCD